MSNWTEEDYQNLMRQRLRDKLEPIFAAEASQPKHSKYRNVKVMTEDGVFDSKREHAYWQELKLREKAGEIADLQRQVAFSLCTIDSDDVRVVVSNYVSDFRFFDRPMQRVRIVDVKGGKETAMFNLKRKWLFLQSGIEVEVVR